MHLVDKRRYAFGNANDNVNLNQIRRYPYFARWRSHLFHYRKDMPSATLTLTLTLTFLKTNCLGSLALASFSLQK